MSLCAMLMQGRCLFYSVYLKACILFDLTTNQLRLITEIPVLPICSKCIFNSCVWGSDVFKAKPCNIWRVTFVALFLHAQRRYVLILKDIIVHSYMYNQSPMFTNLPNHPVIFTIHGKWYDYKYVSVPCMEITQLLSLAILIWHLGCPVP